MESIHLRRREVYGKVLYYYVDDTAPATVAARILTGCITCKRSHIRALYDLGHYVTIDGVPYSPLNTALGHD